MNTSRIRSTAAVAIVALVLAACGTASSPAPEDTSLTVYSGRSEALVSDLYAAFTAETGITVNARYGDSGELAALILAEGSSSPADVFFSQDAGALGAIEESLEVLPQTVLSAVEPQYSAASGRWVGVSGRVRVVVYNSTLVPNPPTTIDELLDSKWSGKIGFAPNNASWQSFVTALRVIRGEAEAEQWLTGFAANKPVAYEKNAVIRDAVNTGEVSLGLVNHYYLYEKIAAEGSEGIVAKNQSMAPGDVGGLINVAGVGILASAPHKAAAKMFVEFMQSDVAAEYFRTKTWEYLLSKSAMQPDGLPPLAELKAPSFDLSNLQLIEATQKLLQKVGLLTR
jgi:iron(III) transport system substrate-binding protein